jgi:formylglycine-generating enzyme required for sulfatase activity
MENISEGTFIMGSPSGEANFDPDERPVRAVTISQFRMGKYQVTQEQYLAVMDINPSYFTTPRPGDRQARMPVERVTWFDAVEFCNKLSLLEGLTPYYTITSRNPNSGYPILSATVNTVSSANGYRLPTEAQWEYACRAGTTTAYNTGNIISDSTGWYSVNSTQTRHVGLKLANAWGLYDMHGNVSEWCWDRYGAYSGTSQTDPTGPTTTTITPRVQRGGNYRSTEVYIRSASRASSEPGIRGSLGTNGFRVVLPN